MNIIYKLLSIIVGAISIFVIGNNMGRKKEQEKELIENNNELEKDIKLINNVVSDSVSDNLNVLLSKQSKKNKK